MTHIPRYGRLDDTVGLLTDGYDYVSCRCDELGSDIFETRLLLEPTICMRGVEAAELFYDTERFTRTGAAPKRLRQTLFGKGGVQGLDGDAHQRRKAMFMSVVTPASVARLADVAAGEWESALARWHDASEVVLFYELREILLRAVCAWAEVPLPENEVSRRRREIGAMIDGAGGVTLRYVRGRVGRKRAERWAAGLIERVRRGELRPAGDTALAIVAEHRELDGSLLTPHDAAVELLNVIRPTVAVARFITFAAHALHQYPSEREKLREGDPQYRLWFADEVRRHYPFFPFVAARVRKTFEWRGYELREGRRALLDLYGTNHDARAFEEPHRFWPERFAQRAPGPFAPIPQGGGDYHRNHRCPGESITQVLTCQAVDYLVRASYRVPPQDLSISRSRFPAIPKSRFVVTDVNSAYTRRRAA